MVAIGAMISKSDKRTKIEILCHKGFWRSGAGKVYEIVQLMYGTAAHSVIQKNILLKSYSGLLSAIHFRHMKYFCYF